VSTKNIEAVLKWVGQGDALPELEAALAELAAIKNHCRVLDNYGVVHSMRFDESKEDDEVNDAADFLSAIWRDEEEAP
jgi:hypothetical protein